MRIRRADQQSRYSGEGLTEAVQRARELSQKAAEEAVKAREALTAPPTNPQGSPAFAAAEEAERLKDLLESPAFKNWFDAWDDYASLVESLRTEDEQRTATLREQLDIIAKISGYGVTQDVDQTRERAIAGAFEGAPEVSRLAPQFGPSGELRRIAEEEAAVDEYYSNALDRLRSYREEQLITNAEYNAQELELKAEHEAALAALEESRGILQLQMAGQVFGDLADITKTFVGEQSNAYKALFAISKAAAIAESIVNIQAAIAKASNNPFPANLAAIATVASQTAGIVAAIQSTVIAGQAHAGMDRVPATGTLSA